MAARVHQPLSFISSKLLLMHIFLSKSLKSADSLLVAVQSGTVRAKKKKKLLSCQMISILMSSSFILHCELLATTH